MEFGIFSKVYEGKTLEQVLTFAEREGFCWLHINLETLALKKEFDAIPPELTQKVAALFDSSTVRPATLSATYNMIHPDNTVRKQGLRRMKELIILAGMAGIPYAAICTGTNDPTDMWAPHKDNHTAESWKKLTYSIEQLLPTCERMRVRMLVEPEQHNVISSPEDARRLLDEMRSPALGVIMDACNLMNAETIHRIPDTLCHAFEILREDICLAHAKDFLWDDSVQKIQFLPAGRGCMDYQLYIALLSALPRCCPILLHGLEAGSAAWCRAFLQNEAECVI